MASGAPPADDAVPEAIGAYRVIRRLATGGMAEVFLAEHDDHASPVVIKRLLPHLLVDARFVEMFRREAKVALTIDHPHVVRTHELGEDRGRPFLAMAYIDGLTLKQFAIREWLARRPIGLAHLARIVGEIAEALDHLHHLPGERGEGFVHRDISPENIMIAVDGTVTLLDFGIAREEKGGALTRTGELKGKVPYMAPEQVRGEPVTAASDLFSLGVTLYWALCRRRPFDRGSELSTMNAIVDDLPDEPIGFQQALPDDVVDLLAQMLEKEPLARPRRGANVARALAPHQTESVAALAARVQAAQAKDIDELKADWGLSSGDPTVTEVTPPDGRRTDSTVAWRRRFRSGTRTNVGGPERRAASTTVAVLLGLGLVAALVALLVRAETAPDEPARVVQRGVPPPRPVLSGPSPVPRPRTPDAGPAPAAAPGPKPAKPRPVKRAAVEVKGPPTVTWDLPPGGVAPGARTVRARHLKYGSVHDVPIRDGVADFDALGTGRIEFRVVPYAKVSIGTRALGTTPFLPVVVPAGRYTVTLRFDDRVREESVTVQADQTARVKVNFTRPEDTGAGPN